MSSTRSVMVSGLAAAIIAIALIGSVVGAGLLETTRVVSTSTPTETVTSISTTSSSSDTSSPSSTSTESQPNSGGGTLAVLMTDPPTVPNGTSAVYITYSNLAIHVSGAGNNSGWYSIGSQRAIDLMSVINVTQTIASTSIQSGTFDALRFNITSATVTFNGVNYTASLVYQQHMLYVQIVGGITVVDGQASAAVIDLAPTVLLLGTPSNPSFAFIPSASAFTVPAQSIPAHALRVGDREDVHDQAWFQNVVQNRKFEISAVVLTPMSLSVTVVNNGRSSMLFRMVGVTSLSSVSGGEKVSNLIALASISQIFAISQNTTLIPLSTSDRIQMGQTLLAGGYLLPPQASVTFNYTGPIQTGFYQSGQSIQAGGRYVVTVLGNSFLAESLTVAQSS